MPTNSDNQYLQDSNLSKLVAYREKKGVQWPWSDMEHSLKCVETQAQPENQSCCRCSAALKLPADIFSDCPHFQDHP